MTWLRDLEELRGLTQRYARAVDGRDMEALAGLFDPEGTIDGARGLAGVATWLEGLRSGPRMFEISMHVLGEPLIDLQPGAEEARMDTYAVVHQLRPAGAAEDDLILGIRYLDEVVRRGEGWVIRHRRAVNLWTRAVPAR